MGWLIALLIIAALCTLILLLPVRVIIRFLKLSDETDFKINVKIGFVKLKILPSAKEEKPERKKKKKPESEKEKPPMGERIKKGIKLYQKIAEDIKEILSYTAQNAFRFELIDINLGYGTEDAAVTGVLYGVISGTVYGLTATIGNFARVDEQKIIINPDFTKSTFGARGKCIVKLQNVHIIVIMVKTVKLLLKIRKERD